MQGNSKLQVKVQAETIIVVELNGQMERRKKPVQDRQ